MKLMFVRPYILSIIILSSCNGARFSGPGRGNASTPSKSGLKLACTASPRTLALGQAVNIHITRQDAGSENLFQSISQKNVPNSPLIQSIIVGRGTQFTLQNGVSNTVSPSSVGTYTIELRLESEKTSASSSATCTFVVESVRASKSFVGCDFVQKTVPVGTSLPIIIDGSTPALGSSYNGTLTQTLTGPIGSNTQIDSPLILSRVDGKWVPSNRSPNTVHFTNVGDYTIKFSPEQGTTGAPRTRVCQVKVEAKICGSNQDSIGARVAFIVDNSNSNASTDCPNRRKIGHNNGADLFTCQGPTNREKAVSSAFRILEGIGSASSHNSEAQSSVSISSFPTRENIADGYAIETNGWIPATSSKQGLIDTAMKFTNQPLGMTPYGAALRSAKSLFDTTIVDGKARIAVLITDGEPTDSKPLSVLAQADALKSAGIELITVFVTGRETQTTRKAKHANMLAQFDQKSLNRNGTNWFEDGIRSLGEYIGIINGSRGVSDLATRISSKSDKICRENSETKCRRNIVKISDSAGLKDAIETIIRTRAIQCR